MNYNVLGQQSASFGIDKSVILGQVHLLLAGLAADFKKIHHMVKKFTLALLSFPSFFLLRCYYHSKRHSADLNEWQACIIFQMLMIFNVLAIALLVDAFDIVDVPWHYFKWFGRNAQTYIGVLASGSFIAWSMSSMGAVRHVLRKESEGAYEKLGLKNFHAVVYLMITAISAILAFFLFLKHDPLITS